MRPIHKIFLITMLLILINSVSIGQVKNVYENMSLDEILNVDVVVTASKKPEDLFEAPLSVTIIKKEQIEKSGVTSIPEALRLAPGLIVREVTPGNYDIHIRGFDDITKNAYVPLPYNTTTLVMIDNRIVYSYFSGGTLWETFPIDINDVERIEVVRGPASALYGPNAANGVINIITSHANEKGMNIKAEGSLGNNSAKNTSANIGYNWNDKTKISFTGNYTERYRFTNDYFNSKTQSYTSIDNQDMLLRFEKNPATHELYTFNDLQEILDIKYDVDVSLKKMGGNIFFFHQFTKESKVDISMGAQNSQSQKTGFLNLVTPLSQINSKSYYIDSRFNIKNFNGQLNINSGEHLSNYIFNSYKFTNVDFNLEYYIQYKNFTARAGIGYKRAKYNSPITYDEPLSTVTFKTQFKDEPRSLVSYALSSLMEWKPSSRLRIIGAIRVDKFNVNSTYSANFEIATTYRINKDNLIRGVYSKSNRSPFIFDTYLNSHFKLNMEYNTDYNQNPIIVPIDANIYASEEIKFPIIRTWELCWRSMLAPNLSLDVELFYSSMVNLFGSNTYREANLVEQLDESNNIDSISSVTAISDFIFENSDLKAKQIGASFMLVYNPSEKIHTKIYGTYQRSKIMGNTDVRFDITNVDIVEVEEDNTRLMTIKSVTYPTRWNEKLTPSFYGGFYLNYNFSKRWDFSTDAYFITKQRFFDFDLTNAMSDYSGIYSNNYMDIKPHINLNLKTSYRLNKNTTASGTIKNVFGKHREFGYSDQIGTLFLIGIKWEL